MPRGAKLSSVWPIASGPNVVNSVAYGTRAFGAGAPVAWSVSVSTIALVSDSRYRVPYLRQIVDERSKGRPYSHRLMDYNNDPSTHVENMRSLFAEAVARMK